MTVTVRLPGAHAPARRPAPARGRGDGRPPGRRRRADRGRDEHDRPGAAAPGRRRQPAGPAAAGPAPRRGGAAARPRGTVASSTARPDGVPGGRGPAERAGKCSCAGPEHLEHRDVHQVEAVGDAARRGPPTAGPATSPGRGRPAPAPRPAPGKPRAPRRRGPGPISSPATSPAAITQRQRRGDRRRPLPHAVRRPPGPLGAAGTTSWASTPAPNPHSTRTAQLHGWYGLPVSR